MKRFFFVVPVLLAGLMTGCKAKVEVELDDDFVITTITLTEADMDDSLASVLTTGIDPWLDTVDVDLRPGEIYVSGTKNGAPGNLTIQMWPQNGELMVAVTSVNIANSNITQERIDNLNARLASGLSKNRRDDNATLTSVVIDNSELALTYQTPRQNNRRR